MYFSLLLALKSFFSTAATKKKIMSQRDLCFHFAISTRKMTAENAYKTIAQALASGRLSNPNTPLFNSLIGHCGKQGNLQLAADAWKMMQSRKVPPDSTTYCTLIDAYAEAGNWHQKALMQPLTKAKTSKFLGRVLSLWEEACEASLQNTQVFNAMLKGISRFGTLEHLALVFPSSDQESFLPVVPDVISYVSAIYAVAYGGGSCWDGEKYFLAMKKHALLPGTSVPKEAILAMLVLFKRSICNFPQDRIRIFRKAKEFMVPYGGAAMLQAGNGNSKILDAYLSICKWAGEYKFAFQLWERYVGGIGNEKEDEEKSIIMQLDDVLQSTFLWILCFNDRFSQAISEWRRIKRPSRLAINAMLEGCRRDCKVKECLEVFETFSKAQSMIPNVHSLEHAFKCIIGPKDKNIASLREEDVEIRCKGLEMILDLVMQREKKLFLQCGELMQEVHEFVSKYGRENEKLVDLVEMAMQESSKRKVEENEK
jgi:pentatricopeptide repeat protein